MRPATLLGTLLAALLAAEGLDTVVAATPAAPARGEAVSVPTAAPFGAIATVSVTNGGASPGNGSSGLASPSADGRFVVFQSYAVDLVAIPDLNEDWDLFRRDLTSGATELVSITPDGSSTGNRGVQARAYSSSNGRYVAFTSGASDLVESDGNRASDAFVRDMESGQTHLVSVNRQGNGPGDGSSVVTGISADGRYVLFESKASDLVPGDSGLGVNVFRRDLELGVTTLVSVNLAGTSGADAGAGESQLTPDGRFALYVGYWDDHVPEDRNQVWDVFVRDLETGTTTLVSVNHAGTGSAEGPSQPIAISRDGRRVAFVSHASDLVEQDTNEGEDVFVRDLKAGRTFLASVSAERQDSGAGRSWIEREVFPQGIFSADGRFVVFLSNAPDLVPNDPDPSSLDVFVRDLERQTTHLVSVGPDGLASHDNTYVCCFALSPKGRHVVFGSSSPVFAGAAIEDTNWTTDLFLRDLTSETTHVVSRSVSGARTADGESYRPVFSAGGDILTFESSASDLVLADDNGSTDVFKVSFEASAPVEPPLGPWLASSSVPGFGFKVRISGADRALLGALEPACIPETVCVSGALPGRSEVFLRVLGPKPNGRLWPVLVKFSTSTVEVWVRQEDGGEIHHYRLEGARPGVDELPGLFDRDGFAPSPRLEASSSGLPTSQPDFLAARAAPAPPDEAFTSEHFPDYRFRARITSGAQVQKVRKESSCIEETLCLSGAVPGRSEVFLRIVGPKPNGWMWPMMVKLTTSTLEVWIERISTGEQKYYRIEGARPGQDELTGLFDRKGFW